MLVAMFVVSAAGCSSETADRPAEVSASTTATGPELDVDIAALVLRQLVGFLNTDDAVAFQELITFAREPVIQDCMQDRGFPYSPVAASAYLPAQEGAELSREDYQRRYGFGITTTRPGSAGEDPNLEYVSSLDFEGREVFSTAVGECSAAVDERLNSALRTSDQLQIELDTLKARIDLDERLVAARSAYSSCMGENGFVTASPEQSRTLVVERLQALANGASRQPATEFEMAISAADLDCSGGYDETYTEVREDAEHEFLEAHRTLLPDDLNLG